MSGEPSVDLMEALEASLAAVKSKTSGRHPAAPPAAAAITAGDRPGRADGVMPPSSPARPGPTSETVCDGCGQARPDEYGLSLPDGTEVGFHSQACFVRWVVRTYIEASS